MKRIEEVKKPYNRLAKVKDRITYHNKFLEFWKEELAKAEKAVEEFEKNFK